MDHTSDFLDAYARRGKPHPRRVLEYALTKADTDGKVRLVEVLLKPSSDPAVRGSQALAMYLLGLNEILGLKPAVIARMFSVSISVVTTFQSSIKAQCDSNARVKAQLDDIIAAINAKDGEPPAVSDGNAKVANDDGPFSEMTTRFGGAKPKIRARIITYKRRIMQALEKHGCMSPGQLAAKLGIELHRLRSYMLELLEDYPSRLTVSGERAARRYSLDGRSSPEAAGHKPGSRAETPVDTRGCQGGSQSKASGRRAGASPASHSAQGAAMLPMSGGGMVSLVQALTGAGGGGESAMMQLTDSGRRAVRAFVRGAAGRVVQDVDALLDDNRPPDPETVERARGGLLFLNLMLEGVAATPGDNPGSKK